MAAPIPSERPREETKGKKAPANDRPNPDEQNKDYQKGTKRRKPSR